eukprot:3947851-Prymnesium_polylepis.1
MQVVTSHMGAPWNLCANAMPLRGHNPQRPLAPGQTEDTDTMTPRNGALCGLAVQCVRRHSEC